MKYLDLTEATPQKNLALDEALLHQAEDGQLSETLRFWESETPFVVLGYSNPYQTEAYVEQCQADQVSILRRPSGGGTVLQGPGCLNFSLILKIDSAAKLSSITESNCTIMKRNQTALQSLTNSKIEIQGHTDLTSDGLKFSGNAQRRKRNFLLFHGTFLYNFDLNQVAKYLQMPSKQPDYRQNRLHDEFITNVALKPEDIKEALRNEWNANEELSNSPSQEVMHQLIIEKYSNQEWNEKF